MYGKNTPIYEGLWKGVLQLKQNISLPFNFEVRKIDSSYVFSIHNASERIILVNIKTSKDSFILEFPSFNSSLFLKIISKKQLTGYWLNLNKGSDYRIPCTVNYGYQNRFSANHLFFNHKKPIIIEGKWETIFSLHEKDEYQAIGLFQQKGNELSGTFLTETGDYRFLGGNVAKDSIYLSSFDGSHAFLFQGKIINGEINGVFYSGKHWETSWFGKRNKDFELKNADSITFMKNNEPFHFDFNDLNGNSYTFPNDQMKNKVLIIQLMGTWCPNCLDESYLLNEFYNKYHDSGLEIISICFEIGKTEKEYIQSIQRFKERKQFPFLFLVGGEANKQSASGKLNQINEISAFPTTIFIDKKGNVAKIHTGFNGPGTGENYLIFKDDIDLFIKKLLLN